MKHAETYLGQLRRKSVKAGAWMHGTRSVTTRLSNARFDILDESALL